MSYTVFMDVGPLQELRYAGISNVTLQLCRYWLNRSPTRSQFFLGPHIVSRDVVETVVEARSGGLFQALLTGRQAIVDHVANVLRGCVNPVALFPNVKSLRNIFTTSFEIVHDLSFLLAPEFHHPDTLAYHGLTILDDLATNAHTLCVSAATRSDLVDYLGVPSDRISVCHPGGDPPPEVSYFVDQYAGCPTHPYVVIPGTIEPRKNIDLVLLSLKRNPSLFRDRDWVFLGGAGWLIEFHDRLAEYGLVPAYRSGAIKWFGYVDEYQKALLYRHAELAIYPSYFEGFGIPVVEAMHHGCPVVCSCSSGIPEAGGEAAAYFDPTSIVDFEAALATVLALAPQERQRWIEACRRHARGFTSLSFGEAVDRTIAATLGETPPSMIPAMQKADRRNGGIVGFLAPGTGSPSFVLADGMARARQMEIDRITGLAERIAEAFGPSLAVAFLFFELLGQPPPIQPDSCSQFEGFQPFEARKIVGTLLATGQRET